MSASAATRPAPTPPADDPRSRPLLSDAARRVLRRAVLDGTLRPGEQLSDADLIDWLGVSRTPIRSALDDLRDLGLVELSANRWTRVALPSRADLQLDAEVWSGLLAPLLRRSLRASGPDATRAGSLARLLRRGAALVDAEGGAPLAIAELGTVAAVPLVLARHHAGRPLREAFLEVSARLGLGLSAHGCGVPRPAWDAYASALSPALDAADADAAIAATTRLVAEVLATSGGSR